MKMENKTEKFITSLYLLFTLANFYYIIKYFATTYWLKKISYEPGILLLESIPFFIVGLILYKRKHKSQINFEQHNVLAKRLKYLGIIIFVCFVALMIVFAIKSNSNYQKYFFPVDGSYMKITFLATRDILHVIWIIIFLIFGVNFYKQTDINKRFENLKNLNWSLLLFGVLVPFSMVIGAFIYNLLVKIVFYF